MLLSGMVIMYHTKAFWGLESNTNAATINNTFNTFTNLTSIIVVVVLIIAIVLVSTVSRGF